MLPDMLQTVLPGPVSDQKVKTGFEILLYASMATCTLCEYLMAQTYLNSPSKMFNEGRLKIKPVENLLYNH